MEIINWRKRFAKIYDRQKQPQPKEPKETWRLNVLWNPGWDPGTDKGH